MQGTNDLVVVINRGVAGIVMDDAKRQLTSLIDGLPDGTFLGIVAYYDGSQVWRAQLAPMTRESRTSAQQFVAKLTEKPPGASAEAALRTAATMNPRNVVLLSDGHDPKEQVLEAARYFAKWGIHIDTIALGSSPDYELLLQVAEITGGVALAQR
jgi:hypothetical protein